MTTHWILNLIPKLGKILKFYLKSPIELLEHQDAYMQESRKSQIYVSLDRFSIQLYFKKEKKTHSDCHVNAK